MQHRQYQARLRQLGTTLAGSKHGFRLAKGTTSNLFRYASRGRDRKRRAVSLAEFNHVLEMDTQGRVLEVEGLTTYQQIVRHTLPRGLLPTVTPELKHITVGGATVGIGIESSGFRHGFVHDGLLEAEVLLPDGMVVTCAPDNEHAALFHGLANSYGTLGYILRARIRLEPAAPRVRVTNTRYHDVGAYIEALRAAADNGEQDFLEGLFYSPTELYLTTGRFIGGAGDAAEQGRASFDIYRDIYYKALRGDAVLELPTADYIFRYDPDWFWNVPETGFYRWFRRFAPRTMRSSGFYNRYVQRKKRFQDALGIKPPANEEKLIQDWEVAWEHAATFTRFILENVDIQGQPWVALPIRPRTAVSNYPVKPGELLYNVGCYCIAAKPRPDIDYHYTRLLDEQCFALGGLKMLYSSTFLERQQFDAIYNGAAYRELKKKYDPQGLAPDLYEKTVVGG